MSRVSKIVVTLLLLAGFGAALFFSLRGQKMAVGEQKEQARAAAEGPLNGYISLDVEPFFKDERVRKVLADKRLSVNVSRVGSRDMAGKVGLATAASSTTSNAAPAQADFYFPSGVVAANQIVEAARKANLPSAQSSPFFTPMVLASWQPIAKILVANGLAKPLGDKTFGVDMNKLTTVMLAKKR